MTVSVGGVPLEMVIDSGASTNVMDKHLWEDLKKKHIKYTSEVPFVFGPEQQESFRELKRRLAQADTLSYFE